jgi:hypothetical protein
MNFIRDLSSEEKTLLAALLEGKEQTAHFVADLVDLAVKQMDDGGMGSLSLIPKSLQNTARSFGKRIVLGEFFDKDGIAVSVAVNLDQQGQLFELDIWKVDFSPLLAWPDPGVIKILE